MDVTIIVAVLALLGVLLGAVIAGLVALSVARRSTRAAYIDAERVKWREYLRNTMTGFYTGKIDEHEAYSELTLRLNPFDQVEQALLDAMSGQETKSDKKPLLKGISLILKHDWERAKIENSRLPFFAGTRAKWRVDRQRRKLPRLLPESSSSSETEV